jgi:hypothetical protein
MVIWVMGSLVDWTVRDVVAGFGEMVRLFWVVRVWVNEGKTKVS